MRDNNRVPARIRPHVGAPRVGAPGDANPRAPRLSRPPFRLRRGVVRESPSLTRERAAEPEPEPELAVEGGTLYLRLVAVAGETGGDAWSTVLLDNRLPGTRLYRFRGRRSIDGRRKKLTMCPPTTHRIRIPGMEGKVWVKEFDWKTRYLIVGS